MQHNWSELQRRGFGEHHLLLLQQLLESNRNGSWQVHVHDGRVTQVDMRILSPPVAPAVAQLEMVLAKLEENGHD